MNPTIWTLLGVGLVVVVAMVAYIRRRPKESSGVTLAPEPASLPVTLPLVAAEVEKRAKAFDLVYGQTADAPALTIGAWGNQPIPSNAHELNTKSSGLSSLTQLAQVVPSLLTAAEFGGNNYMKVVVNGPLAAATDGGFFPFVRGADGKIAEMANLQHASDLGKLINAAAVWQIASVIVAQKHLADISRKLDELKSSIEAVRQHQKDSRRSIVRGGIRYLLEATEVVGRGEMPMANRNEIEAFLRDLLTTQDHIEKDIQSAIQKIQSVQGGDRFGTSKLFEALSQHEKVLAELIAEWTQCVHARIVTWFVLTFYAGEHQQKDVRIKHIRRSIDDFVNGSDGLGELMEHWNKKLASINAWLTFDVELEKRRVHVRSQVDLTRYRLEIETMKFRQSIKDGSSLLLQVDQPITLAVRVDQMGELQAYEIAAQSAFIRAAG